MRMTPARIARAVRPRGAAAIVFLLAAAVAIVSPGHASAPMYKAAFYSYPTGYQPKSVAAADLNSDGRTDAVLACWASDCVSVMFGNTDGSYGPTVNVPTGHHPSVVALADMNADGASDIVTTGESDIVYVMLNDGSGSFTQTAAVAALATGNRALAIGDVNRDGHLDVVTYAGFFAGNGSGGLAAGVGISGTLSAETVALCDLNGDSKLDLLVCGTNFSVSLRGHGDGTFDAAAGSIPATYLAVGDMNEDGRPDAVSAYSNVLLMNLGNGAGGFASPVVLSNAGADLHGLVIGDVNGDNHLDVMSVSYNGAALTLFLGDGHGGLSPRKGFLSGLQPGGLALAAPSAGAPLTAYVAGEGANGLLVHPGNGTSTFSTSPAFTIPNLNGFTIARANGDASPDIIGWMANTSYGGFYWAPFQGGPNIFGGYVAVGGHGAAGMAVGDFNSDGLPDVVVTNGTAYTATRLTAQLYLSNGNGTFAPEVDVPIGVNPWENTPKAIVAADFNEDGALDLAVARSGDGQIAILIGNGTGGFGPPVALAGPWGANVLRVGDVNGDGHLDLVGLIGSANGVVVWTLRGDGAGGFGPIALTSVFNDAQDLAVGDLNADGLSDIGITGYNGGIITMLATGAGTFLVEHLLNLSIACKDIFIADLDHDGNADVIATHGVTLVAVLRGAGDGGFVERQDFGGGARLGPPVDLNGDGVLDLVLTGSNDNTGTVLTSVGGMLAVDPARAARQRLDLRAAPNPAMFFAAFHWVLGSSQEATLRIVDVTGRSVAQLQRGVATAGEHTTAWNLRGVEGARVAPGIYFAELQVGSLRVTRRIVVIQ